jgi:protein ImuB
MLFGCVHIPNLSCQAAVRVDPLLMDKAVAVIAGSPPLVRVAAINAAARKLGLEIGMTKTEAESCHGLVIREQSLALEASAHAALVDCVARFSPRCEDVSADTVILDLSGLRKLMGTPLQIAQSIREQACAMSLHVNVGVASNIDSAIHAARVAKGIRILPEGREADELQEVSITVLDPPSEVLKVFERWGIRTLGQLAALPEIALTERLGQEGLRLHRLANGKSTRTLSPTEPPLEFRESMELDSPVADIESLSFIFGRLLEQLCTRLLSRSLAAGVIRVDLVLEVTALDATAPSKVFTRVAKLPVPTTDTRLLLKLLQLDLDAHPPGAPVLMVSLEAEPMRPRRVQEGMFVPSGPEPQRLEVTLARLRKLVGEDRVGSAELIARHTISAFRMVSFQPAGKPTTVTKQSTLKAALRVYRPNLPARVQSARGAPVTIGFEGQRYRVLKAAGPWRRSGEWWTQDHWGRDEWDLVLTAREQHELLVKVYRNHFNGEWYVEGEYD